MQFAINICFFYEKLTNTPLPGGHLSGTPHFEKENDIINPLKKKRIKIEKRGMETGLFTLPECLNIFD